MICPLKFTVLADPEVGSSSQNIEKNCHCEMSTCAWWDEKAKQCCIKTLSHLKIQGGINTHPY